MSAALASSRLAASGLPLAMILSATPMVATPLIAMVRLPPVKPSGTTSLSPCTSLMLLDIDAELGRGDLAQRRLVALAVGLVAGDRA